MATHTDVRRTTTYYSGDEADDSSRPTGTTLAARVVYYLLGIIEVILAFRFVLSLLGANRGSGFGQLVYGLSYPFVQPFFGLFNYTPQYGTSHLELFTLVAMAVYALVAWGIIVLIRLPRRGQDV